jgi:putative transposase
MEGAPNGASKKSTSEQAVNILRQVEVTVAGGKTTVLACTEAAIPEQTH